MGFFAQFFLWLNTTLATYIGTNAARVASAIEPAAVSLAVVYVMVWGWLQMRGAIQQPFWDGIRRILLLAIVLGVGLRLWTYNGMLVDVFFRAPSQFAAAVLGAPTAVGAIDQIWDDGNKVAESLMSQGGVLSGDVSFYIAAFLVYLMIGVTCVYGAFLLALSLIAVAVLLALGPVFIVLLLFEATRRYFEAWISQLANYAFIGILLALVASLLLGMVRAYSQTAVASGDGVTLAESMRLCMASILIFLVMRQVMPIAARLGGGIALSTFNTMGLAVGWMLGRRGGGSVLRRLASIGRGDSPRAGTPPRTPALAQTAGRSR